MKKLVFYLFIIISISSFRHKDFHDTHSNGNRGLNEQRINTVFTDFLKQWNIPGASLAYVKDGKVIYKNSFGKADDKTSIQENNQFRIASLSKPITAAAILKLVDQKKINLDDKVFGEKGLLPEYKTIKDPRVFCITIKNLLDHTAGWDRISSIEGDPMFNSISISQCMATSGPPDACTILNYMLSKDLDFNPGERFSYSNFGYAILGRIIEKVTNISYERFVKENIFVPAGMNNTMLGKSRQEEKFENEVSYYSTIRTRSVFNPGTETSCPYGGFCLESMDSHGGWVSTASDLASFLLSINTNTEATVISHAQYNNIIDPENIRNGYSMGWYVNIEGNLWHTGSLPGSSALMAKLHDGSGWIILLNSNPCTMEYFASLDRLMWKGYKALLKKSVN